MTPQNRQAPVLDRKAVLGIPAAGEYGENGRWQSGAIVEHSIWVCIREWDVMQEPSASSWRQTGIIELVARYRRDVLVEAVNGALGSQTGLAFVDWELTLDGLIFSILDAEEMPMYGRRRFMKIRAERRS